MKDIKIKQWSDFVLSEIFDITSTKSGIDKKKLNGIKGNIPYVTRTDKTNGWENFICQQDLCYRMDNANSISIGLDTQTVFYQPCDYYTGQNIQVLKNERLNKHIALFIIPILKHLMAKFSWGGNGATLTRLKRSRILLPVTLLGNPDYDFMEQYMRKVEVEKVRLFKKNTIYRIKEFLSQEKLIPLNNKKWREFKIEHIFIIEKCKCSNVSLLLDGNISYVGATNRNNGVIKFVENNAKLITKGNCIAFICDGEGSIGYSVYKNEDFIGSTTIKIGRNKYLNRYVGIFITTIADKVRGKYNFGFKRTEEHLKKETIILPVNSFDEPDYEYMEQYIRNIEMNKLEKYLKYLEISHIF